MQHLLIIWLYGMCAAATFVYAIRERLQNEVAESQLPEEVALYVFAVLIVVWPLAFWIAMDWCRELLSECFATYAPRSVRRFLARRLAKSLADADKDMPRLYNFWYYCNVEVCPECKQSSFTTVLDHYEKLNGKRTCGSCNFVRSVFGKLSS